MKIKSTTKEIKDGKKDEENYWWGLRKEKKIYDYKEERLGTKDIVESKKL